MSSFTFRSVVALLSLIVLVGVGTYLQNNWNIWFDSPSCEQLKDYKTLAKFADCSTRQGRATPEGAYIAADLADCKIEGFSKALVFNIAMEKILWCDSLKGMPASQAASILGQSLIEEKEIQVAFTDTPKPQVESNEKVIPLKAWTEFGKQRLYFICKEDERGVIDECRFAPEG